MGFCVVKPVRVQRKRTKGSKLTSPNGLPIIYVGRPSKWGNPFATAFEYKSWLSVTHWSNRHIFMGLTELRGKNLACWCKLDEECHASILLTLANDANINDECPQK